MRLKDKTAVVTGAGRGIGRAIAIRMAIEGARVIVNYPFEAEEAMEVAREITSTGGEAAVAKADISNRAEREAMFDEALHQFGRLDILVNNAGVDPGETRLLEVDEDVYEEVMSVNMKGTFFCSQAAARAMIAQGDGGRIINISSIQGQLSIPHRGPYASSKGGIDALTRQLAIDLAPFRITVNAIAPGFIEVERSMASVANYSRAEIAKRVPLGRVGFPSDVAALACFLASEEASFVTGQVILSDGGKSVRLAF